MKQYGIETCLECGRRIGLAKHGYFRRHMKSPGERCGGSWEWPHKQRNLTRVPVDDAGSTDIESPAADDRAATEL